MLWLKASVEIQYHSLLGRMHYASHYVNKQHLCLENPCNKADF